MNMQQARTITQWLRIYKLYQISFPRSEKKPFSKIVSTHKRGITDVWYLEENNEFIGMAITINGDDLILLDYFAVAKKKRGQGIGSRILKKLQEHYHEKGILLEIERTDMKADNLDERIRRKQFYQANNFVPMDFRIKFFGVDMEVMGYNCKVNYKEYHNFYRFYYSEWDAGNMKEMK